MRHFIRKSSSCDTMKDIIFYLFFYLLFLRPRFLSTSWCIQFCEMHSVYHQILLLLREKDIFLTVALLLQVLFLKDTYLIFKIIFTALEIILETGIPGESLPPPPPSEVSLAWFWSELQILSLSYSQISKFCYFLPLPFLSSFF